MLVLVLRVLRLFLPLLALQLQFKRLLLLVHLMDCTSGNC